MGDETHVLKVLQVIATRETRHNEVNEVVPGFAPLTLYLQTQKWPPFFSCLSPNPHTIPEQADSERMLAAQGDFLSFKWFPVRMFTLHATLSHATANSLLPLACSGSGVAITCNTVRTCPPCLYPCGLLLKTYMTPKKIFFLFPLQHVFFVFAGIFFEYFCSVARLQSHTH